MKLVAAEDPILHNPVKEYNGDCFALAKTAASMYDFMMERKGLGLAANQVGLSERLLVMGGNGYPTYCLINPILVSYSDEFMTNMEGCLSFPSEIIETSRPKVVTVTALNLFNEYVTYRFTGPQAACVQHEIDHLNGILFHTRTSGYDYMMHLHNH